MKINNITNYLILLLFLFSGTALGGNVGDKLSKGETLVLSNGDFLCSSDKKYKLYEKDGRLCFAYRFKDGGNTYNADVWCHNAKRKSSSGIDDGFITSTANADQYKNNIRDGDSATMLLRLNPNGNLVLSDKDGIIMQSNTEGTDSYYAQVTIYGYFAVSNGRKNTWETLGRTDPAFSGKPAYNLQYVKDKIIPLPECN